MTAAQDRPALVADVGGTNVRFALVRPAGRPEAVQILRAEDHPGLAEAALAYLESAAPERMPTAGAFAVASPITGDQVLLTNRAWSFSMAALQQRLKLRRLRVINDFTAIALAIPHLLPEDTVPVGGGTAVPDAAIGVIGPGTGLGVSGLIPCGGRWMPLDSEGGHATMAPATDRESVVLTELRQQIGHVSAERVVSGMGLVNLYGALARIENRPADRVEPADVTRRAATGACPLCAEAVAMFCGFLGTAASNLALTLGARGGVHIAGGIVPKLGPVFLQSGFRGRFEDKGRFSAYLAAIPTQVIVNPIPAFLGLAALLEGDRR